MSNPASPDLSPAAPVFSAAHRSGGAGFVGVARVILLLAAWVTAFIAFLVAPLIVLGVAWIVALAAIAASGRGSRAVEHPTPVAPAQPHRFGAARAADADQGAAR